MAAFLRYLGPSSGKCTLNDIKNIEIFCASGSRTDEITFQAFIQQFSTKSGMQHVRYPKIVCAENPMGIVASLAPRVLRVMTQRMISVEVGLKIDPLKSSTLDRGRSHFSHRVHDNIGAVFPMLPLQCTKSPQYGRRIVHASE